MKQFFLLIILSFLYAGLFAQNDTAQLVKYDYGFEFKEGIYPDFASFRNNNPIPYESIITPPYNDDFFESLDTTVVIQYNGEFGNTITVPVIEIWGYSKNGKPYILWADKFNLIPFVGKITHFITTVKVYYSNYYDPFYDPYRYDPTARVYQSDELRQFIIDMETGEIMDYNMKNVEQILKRDPELYNDFMELRKRKRNKQLFYFVSLYNAKNPLYIKK